MSQLEKPPIGSQEIARRLCGQATDLTDAEIVTVIRKLVPDGPQMNSDELEGIRLRIVCDLSHDHRYGHAGAVTFGDSGAWLGWGYSGRSIEWPGRCLYQHTEKGWSCMLFEGHAGSCLVPDLETDEPAPSWSRP